MPFLALYFDTIVERELVLRGVGPRVLDPLCSFLIVSPILLCEKLLNESS